MRHNKNYLIQSNFFTQSIMRGVTEMQKDIIYYLQNIIDFRDSDPPDDIIINYDEFLKFKKVDKKNFYSISELVDICIGLIDINGVFYNKQTRVTEFFNVIDGVSVSDINPNEFTIRLTKFGKIFFYEKYAIEYANNSKIQYTQIESSIIDLKGDKRKKFFELLSQYKSTGKYIIKLEDLKKYLGFIVYQSESPNVNSKLHLRSLFETVEDGVELQKIEYLSRWAEFKRVFLDPSIEDFNSNSNLDISNITYETLKKGRKIDTLVFTFKARLTLDKLSDEEKRAIKYFSEYGLNEKQILFLFQRIGYTEMYRRFNTMVTFNNSYGNKDSRLYRVKTWFEIETGSEIKNLGGYLYEKMFPELKKE